MELLILEGYTGWSGKTSMSKMSWHDAMSALEYFIYHN